MWCAELGAACLLLAALVATKGEDMSRDCRFEQTWYAGDQHMNERFDFRGDATGTWLAAGYAEDARKAHEAFRWTRTSDTLTVTSATNVQKTVGYRFDRRGERCYLVFQDHPFVSDHTGFTVFSEQP